MTAAKHWTTLIAPFRVIDNIYYVGTEGRDEVDIT